MSLSSLYMRAVDDGEDQGPRLSATTTTLLVLATVFVGLRFWSRYLVSPVYGQDDWMVVGALAAVFSTGAINYAMIAHGLGRHAGTLDTPDLIAFFKLLLAFECVYVTAVMLVKLSVLKMYLRIFDASRGFRIGAYIIGGTVISWWIAICALCTFQCNPVKRAWMPWLTEGSCINLKGSFIGNAIPIIASDVAILSMPVGEVWRLQINVVQKLSLCVVFLLGSFVLFASIYRFTTIMQFQPADTTWTLATACTWCVVECACGVISACLPTLRPLIRTVSDQFGSSLRSKDASRSGQLSHPPTELVTIGGTGAKVSGRCGGRESVLFSRAGHGGERLGSNDELPLSPSSGTKVTVDNSVEWGDLKEGTSTDGMSQSSKMTSRQGV